MLQATLHGNYRKNGNRIFTYKVSGTAKEIEAYKAAVGDRLVPAEDGAPLFFVSEFINGRKQLIKPKLELAISFGKKVVINDLKASVERDARIAQHQEQALGTIMAELEAGVRTVGNNTPKPTPKPEDETTKIDPNKLIEEGAGATGNQTEETVTAAAGGESLETE